MRIQPPAMPEPRHRTRILYLIDHAVSTGGAERFAIGLAAHLPADRFEPWMCATRVSDSVAAQTLADAGVRLVTLGRTAKWDVHRLAGLIRLLRRERFDILHAHMFGSNVWGSLIGSAVGIPVIVAQEHGWSFTGNPLRAWVDGNVIGRLAARFIAVSEADGSRMITKEGVSPAKVVVIPTGYIPSPVTSDSDIRAALGLDRDTPLIATAAMLRPEKRLDILLAAHTRVLSSLPSAQLVIAGDGECRQELEQLARRLGIDDSVHFLGSRSDVDGVLRTADVAALSSDREGSPLLMFECMANGVPLVATAVGGIPEVIQDGRTGTLVPRRDPDALAQGLLGLLQDPNRRAQIVAAAREQLPRYTIEATAARFAALYDTLTAAANDRGRLPAAR
jgi:glycosyltransferase involved in cell wall biosynthesis